MLVDFNRTKFDYFIGKQFYLQGSNNTFISVKDDNDFYLVELETGFLYSMTDICDHRESFYFYENEEDEDFFGVWIIV